jgi:hypothetical protein
MVMLHSVRCNAGEHGAAFRDSVGDGDSLRRMPLPETEVPGSNSIRRPEGKPPSRGHLGGYASWAPGFPFLDGGTVFKRLQRPRFPTSSRIGNYSYVWRV